MADTLPLKASLQGLAPHLFHLKTRPGHNIAMSDQQSDVAMQTASTHSRRSSGSESGTSPIDVIIHMSGRSLNAGILTHCFITGGAIPEQAILYLQSRVRELQQALAHE